jgi:hypothetical protein|tara:strand:- start:168 stop:578 length:411 start_codon:yes stop_codon:yes gene_type:complete
MENRDYCQVYWNPDPEESVPDSDSAASKIINGRVSVHGILASTMSGSTGGALVGEAPAYYLCETSDQSIISFKFCPIVQMGTKSTVPFIFNLGGNGMLFPDGVYIGRDKLTLNGGGNAKGDLVKCVAILYTGGANA